MELPLLLIVADGSEDLVHADLVCCQLEALMFCAVTALQ
jgi:hypothetical protein